MSEFCEKKTVLIVGLGNIAVGYDALDVSTLRVLTHSRAFSRHPAFKLVGGVDPNLALRSRFETIYSVNAYETIGDVVSYVSPDIVVIATPTAHHLSAIKQVFLRWRPIAILCEKPLAYSLDDARQIVSICEENRCQLFVNFFRLSDPGVSEIRSRLSTGRISVPMKGVVWYSKGIMNSGGHFVNLLQNLLGDIIEIKVISKGRVWSGIDPEPDIDITFISGRVLFLAAKEENFFYNSMELISSVGRLRYESSGEHIAWQGIKFDDRFKGYKCLSKDSEIINTDYDQIQWNVVEQISVALSGGCAQLCTGAAALRTQEALEKIKDEYEKITT